MQNDQVKGLKEALYQAREKNRKLSARLEKVERLIDDFIKEIKQLNNE